MAVALVLGSNGQDGTYACAELARLGYSVVGMGRQSEATRPPSNGAFRYLQIDLRDAAALEMAVRSVSPDRIVHVAAVHGSAAADPLAYEKLFRDMLAVNVGSVHVLLEYMRTTNSDARMVYASSAKAFGKNLVGEIDETAPARSDCLYSNTKNSAGDLIRHYRGTHGLVASVAYLFNHESPLRSPEFFVPKLARAIAESVRDAHHTTEFRTLDFHCDWGSAEEYMGILVEMLERTPAEDFVLASGTTTHAGSLVETTFRARHLSARDHLTTPAPELPHAEPPFTVNLGTLRRRLGRTPSVPIEAIVEELVELALAR